MKATTRTLTRWKTSDIRALATPSVSNHGAWSLFHWIPKNSLAFDEFDGNCSTTMSLFYKIPLFWKTSFLSVKFLSKC
jgi:hypothetical protein